MNNRDSTIAIIGAGVAGSRLAFLLASQGKPVALFDPRAPWEKPCGGGLTPKVLRDFPELSELNLETRKHDRLRFVFPSGRRITLELSRPFLTVSRERLGAELLRKAQQAGAEFISAQVESAQNLAGRLVIKTAAGDYPARLVVGADGVNSLIRRTFASRFTRGELAIAFEQLIPGEVSLPIIFKLFREISGYSWIFPRSQATSVGIVVKLGEATRDFLAARLKEFVLDEFARAGISAPELGRPRAWMLPAFPPESFANPSLGGEGWALIGDASGAVDPLSGEGIYYALKTADLLAAAILSGAPLSYPKAWKVMAKTTIGRVSSMREIFFRPAALECLSLLLDYVPCCHRLAQRIISGERGYETLKRVIYSGEKILTPLNFGKAKKKDHPD